MWLPCAHLPCSRMRRSKSTLILFIFAVFPALSADQQLFSVVRRRNKGGGERSHSDKISGQRLGIVIFLLIVDPMEQLLPKAAINELIQAVQAQARCQNAAKDMEIPLWIGVQHTDALEPVDNLRLGIFDAASGNTLALQHGCTRLQLGDGFLRTGKSVAAAIGQDHSLADLGKL